MANNGFTSVPANLPSHIRAALASLLIASRYAQQVESDPWEFAVEIEQFADLGLTPNDFRWLVRSGMVTHQREVTLEGENGRQFHPAGDLTYCDRSCFVLTDCGIQMAKQVHPVTSDGVPVNAKPDVEHVSQNGCGQSVGSLPANVPIWDAERRNLRFNGAIVKHFKWVAINQQAVLCAFEEDGWPPRIDDPLPPHAEQDSKRRLADTIKCLNRKQCHAIVHFRGDGTGEGIIWEAVEMAHPGH